MAFQQYTALLRRVASNNGWSCTVLQQALCTRLVGTVGGNAQQPHNPSQVTSCREPHDTAVYTISHYFHTRVLHFPVLDVPVPSMGESITEGTVADILKQPGEALAADDIILQIETDKVTIDVRAPHDGVLTSVKVAMVGETTLQYMHVNTTPCVLFNPAGETRGQYCRWAAHCTTRYSRLV